MTFTGITTRDFWELAHKSMFMRPTSCILHLGWACVTNSKKIRLIIYSPGLKHNVTFPFHAHKHCTQSIMRNSKCTRTFAKFPARTFHSHNFILSAFFIFLTLHLQHSLVKETNARKVSLICRRPRSLAVRQ